MAKQRESDASPERAKEGLRLIFCGFLESLAEKGDGIQKVGA